MNRRPSKRKPQLYSTGWQRPETAPKDGTEVLILTSDLKVHVAAWEWTGAVSYEWVSAGGVRHTAYPVIAWDELPGLPMWMMP